MSARKPRRAIDASEERRLIEALDQERLRSEVQLRLKKVRARDRDVIVSRFGFYTQPQSLKDIANRLGVSSGRVRQLLARALVKVARVAPRRLMAYWQ